MPTSRYRPKASGPHRQRPRRQGEGWGGDGVNKARTVNACVLAVLVAGLLSHHSLAADAAALSTAQPLNAPTDIRAAIATTTATTAVRKRLPGYRPGWANFEQEKASADARFVADWVVDSGDNLGLPFALVDKKDARVFVFDADGRLRGAAPALLGLAVGDVAVPGIGNRPLSSIRREERTTPAGRFVASLDRNLSDKEILWVDYDGAVSMHPVVSANTAEHRLHRLASATPLDNRISYGCINVSAKFFETIVHPAFFGTNGIVYVLPEVRSTRDVFGSYDVAERVRQGTTAPAGSPPSGNQ